MILRSYLGFLNKQNGAYVKRKINLRFMNCECNKLRRAKRSQQQV